jgi:NADPH:quinone reductase-like Zn-dependent oxidoreductase
VKGVVYDRYGSPDLLRVEEVPVPSPAAGQVRVKIAATSVNLSDWECLRGSPAYARIGGLRFPACRTLGSDIAGLVDDVGEGVTPRLPGCSGAVLDCRVDRRVLSREPRGCR